VLTEDRWFLGADEYLVQARAACALPVIRKDFMIDPIQIVQSRAIGADAILIIMAAVDDACARDLHAAADALDLAVLLEAHDESELERALALPSPLVGVNNRDLRRFVTDLGVSERLSALIPSDRLLISESGVAAPADIVRLRGCGARSFLIGEVLMRAEDPEAAVRALVEAR
jgi:indole-3-glycerol phosphate synthase